MALQIALPETTVGLPAPSAYAKIVAFHYDVSSNRVDVYVNIYASEAARRAHKNPIEGGAFSGTPGVDMPTLDASITGVRAALYAWLKTLPKFEGAVDIIVDEGVAPVVEPTPAP